ncbi:MAG: lactate racemase domain-containing protein [Myxococcales bacterium]
MLSIRYGTETLPLPPSVEGLAVLAREEPPPLADPLAALRAALNQPVAGPTLEQHLAGRRRVGVVLPDGTRPLPTMLIEELLDALGTVPQAVRIANGTHRRTTPAEHQAMLGRHFGKVEVGDRATDDPASHIALSAPDRSIAASIDRVAAGCDALVLMGPMAFHYLAGFGGGGKLIAPGLSDRATAEFVHSACLAAEGGRHPLARAGVIEGNPLRDRLEIVCRAAPPQFYVIPLLDSAYRPVAFFAGERSATFRAAAQALSAAYGVGCRRHSTVIACAGGHPYDIDFVQAHKAWEMANAACKPGGTIVWVARCPEGLPPRHRAFLEKHRTAAAMESALRERFDIAAHTVWAARAKGEQRRVLAVTELPREVVTGLGMEPTESLEAALRSVSLDDALLLPLGSRFLPIPS